MRNNTKNNIDIFENMPVKKAAMTLVIPTVISQLVMLVYNMADTWYIGQTGDPYQVAAVTVTYPIFMVLNALANIFGIGGGSLISRMLGNGEKEKTGAVAAFSLWAAGFITLVYSLLCFLNDRELLHLLGTDETAIEYAHQYLFWTVVAGGLPTILNLVLAGIIRAEGEAKISSIGMSLGGILNVIMDPVFIFGMNMGVAGAALSTCISNTASLVFLLVHVVRNRKYSLVRIPLLPERIERNKRLQIYSVGTPAALQIILAAVSNAVLLRLMSGYAVEAISGMGVMQKVESIPFQAIMGISDGVIPLVAYNYAANNKKRMNQAVRFALSRGIACACICFVLLEIFAPQVVGFFIDDAQSIVYGAVFVRLRVLALPFIIVEFMMIAVFQGIGKAKQAFVLSVFRKGIFDLPLMVLFNMIIPMYGLMLVQPVMEFMGCIIAVIMYILLHKNELGNNKVVI